RRERRGHPVGEGVRERYGHRDVGQELHRRASVVAAALGGSNGEARRSPAPSWPCLRGRLGSGGAAYGAFTGFGGGSAGAGPATGSPKNRSVETMFVGVGGCAL